MKYVDVAVAVLVGVSAVAGILFWTPRSGDLKSGELAARAELGARVAGVVQAKGMSWFLSAPPPALCSYLAGLSNSTVHLFADVGGATCGDAPPGGAVQASIAFRVVNLRVDVGAWSDAGP